MLSAWHLPWPFSHWGRVHTASKEVFWLWLFGLPCTPCSVSDSSASRTLAAGLVYSQKQSQDSSIGGHFYPNFDLAGTNNSWKEFIWIEKWVQNLCPCFKAQQLLYRAYNLVAIMKTVQPHICREIKARGSSLCNLLSRRVEKSEEASQPRNIQAVVNAASDNWCEGQWSSLEIDVPHANVILA